ncbi:MAG: methyl-accepting chemotaxis protein [Candidatus Heimdallarchaeota archaeon]
MVFKGKITLRYSYLMQSLFPINIAFILLYALLYDEYMGLPLSTWLMVFIPGILGCSIIIIIAYLRLGRKDYRLWLTFHLVIACLSVLFSSSPLESSEALKYPPTSASLTNFAILFMGAMIVIIGSILSIYSLSDGHFQEFRIVAEDVTQGQLATRVRKEQTLNDSVFGPIATLINEMADYLQTTLMTVSAMAERLSTSSEELAATTEEVNASSEEVAATIQNISQGAAEQANLSERASHDVMTMSSAIDTALGTIQGASSAIQDISAQTNMLALNAAIEAARAAEYGRGFSVVADNVRTLAESSGSSATNISNVTNEIQDDLGNNFGIIQGSVQSIASVAEEFSASTEEVSAAMEEMTASMQEASENSQELAQMAEELASIVQKFNIY